MRISAWPSTIFHALGSLSAVRVVVEDFEEDESPLQAEIEAKIIARVCKRAAVKAGQSLSVEEQRALLRDLEACRSPRTCPKSGRSPCSCSAPIPTSSPKPRGGS